MPNPAFTASPRLILAALFAMTWAPAGRAAETQTVRFATFNVSLYDTAEGKVAQRLATPGDAKASAIAEIIQRVRPDVILLNEFDYDADGNAITNFQMHYLGVGQNVSQSPEGPAEPIAFAHRYLAPVNTGIHSGFDLDRNGREVTTPGSRDYGGDCWGYGEYPGQYGMVVLSRFPIDTAQVRTFRKFLWKDMPAAQLPDDPATDEIGDWYSAEALAKFPLSSKSHWDIPIRVSEHTIHVLASHPTPPTFDGPENRNGRRNHDEVRFWLDYITPVVSRTAGSYIYDDKQGAGGLPPGEAFVIMGDQNGDPNDGQGQEAIAALLASPQVSTEPVPASTGGREQAKLQGGANATQQGDPQFDTLDADDDRGPGNLRVDYVIPARSLKTLASGVFWPENGSKLFSLVGTRPFPSSDHRLVWIEVVSR